MNVQHEHEVEDIIRIWYFNDMSSTEAVVWCVRSTMVFLYKPANKLSGLDHTKSISNEYIQLSFISNKQINK